MVSIKLMAPAIAITTEDSRHIGFLLLAPNGADAGTGVEMGDCIFRSLSVRSEDFTHDLAERLHDYQQRGELEDRRNSYDASTSVAVAVDADFTLRSTLMPVVRAVFQRCGRANRHLGSDSQRPPNHDDYHREMKPYEKRVGGFPSPRQAFPVKTHPDSDLRGSGPLLGA